MYKCTDCGNVFDEPHKMGRYIEAEYVCPNCGSEYYEEAERCGNPTCYNYVFKGKIICKACQVELLNRFKAFADELTAAEEEQLDEWTSGLSITERGKIKVDDV